MTSISWLDEKLNTLAKSDDYPFHMPGHKRQPAGNEKLLFPEQIDITEIPGFDNLHQCEGILKEAQERMAALFGAWKSFFLVNGSTAGILSAVHAATHRGDRILIARNCHRSVYHAVLLRELRTGYLYPSGTDAGIQGSIPPEQVRNMLDEAIRQGNPYAAVLITSPTYDGVLSDVSSISEIAHERGIPLLVDSAHGAHLGLYPGTENAISPGADCVIESLHKTLPSLTQTAVLHLADSPWISADEIRRYLSVFQTSSPSYILMASMDRCTRILTQQGDRLFTDFSGRLKHFYEFAGRLRTVEVLPPGSAAGIFDRDPTKILFRIRSGSGEDLLQWMYREHHLVMEMAAGSWVTALTSLMDTDEGFRRLRAALSDLDRRLNVSEASEPDSPLRISAFRKAGTNAPFRISDFRKAETNAPFRFRASRKTETHANELRSSSVSEARIPMLPEKRMEIHEALLQESSTVPFDEAAGRISGAFVGLYPPGIPLLVPGERISEEMLTQLWSAMQSGASITGLPQDSSRGKMLSILKK